MLFLAILVIMTSFLALSQVVMYLTFGKMSFAPLLIFIPATVGVLLVLFCYFKKQDIILEEAASKIEALLAGDTEVRIANEEEGELYRLFWSINNMAAVLTSKASKEKQEKIFLKNTISDISHQLKTPLAALNIYNGILEEAEDMDQVR